MLFDLPAISAILCVHCRRVGIDRKSQEFKHVSSDDIKDFGEIDDELIEEHRLSIGI
jgi:hypothetical protein